MLRTVLCLLLTVACTHSAVAQARPELKLTGETYLVSQYREYHAAFFVDQVRREGNNCVVQIENREGAAQGSVFISGLLGRYGRIYADYRNGVGLWLTPTGVYDLAMAICTQDRGGAVLAWTATPHHPVLS